MPPITFHHVLFLLCFTSCLSHLAAFACLIKVYHLLDTVDEILFRTSIIHSSKKVDFMFVCWVFVYSLCCSVLVAAVAFCFTGSWHTCLSLAPTESLFQVVGELSYFGFPSLLECKTPKTYASLSEHGHYSQSLWGPNIKPRRFTKVFIIGNINLNLFLPST